MAVALKVSKISGVYCIFKISCISNSTVTKPTIHAIVGAKRKGKMGTMKVKVKKKKKVAKTIGADMLTFFYMLIIGAILLSASILFWSLIDKFLVK